MLEFKQLPSITKSTSQIKSNLETDMKLMLPGIIEAQVS